MLKNATITDKILQKVNMDKIRYDHSVNMVAMTT